MRVRVAASTVTICTLVVLAGVAVGSSAAAASNNNHCGKISHRSLNGLGGPNAVYQVFTYRYERCSRARRIIRSYLRRVRRLKRCPQDGCVRRVLYGWKCRSPQYHGTMIGCVPRRAAWSSPNRPFVGVSRSG